MAEQVTITKREGTPDRSGAWTVIGLVLGILIVAAVVAFVVAGPQIERWWDDGDSGSPGSTVTSTVQTPLGTTTHTHTNPGGQ